MWTGRRNGRLEKLFLKLFVEEEDLSIHSLLVDTSESMNFGSPLTKSRLRPGASRRHWAMSRCLNTTRVLLASFSGGLGERMPPLRGKPGVFPFFQFLETRLPVGGETKFGAALTQYAAQAKNVGIAVILSGLL